MEEPLNNEGCDAGAVDNAFDPEALFKDRADVLRELGDLDCKTQDLVRRWVVLGDRQEAKLIEAGMKRSILQGELADIDRRLLVENLRTTLVLEGSKTNRC